ncbi:phytase [Devosia sp. A8/3-2]|nr:phytase [Devosia sp. A8/3-2]
MKTLSAVLCTVSLLTILPAMAADWSVAEVTPVLQTPVLTEADADADADDPAIYVHPTDPARSLVVTAVKNGGIRVYGLDGALKQIVLPAEDGRINNVDVVYGFALADGSTADIIVGADRGLDIIRAYRIDADAAEPLSEITDPAAARAFPTRYLPGVAETEDNPVDDQNTVYGLATGTTRRAAQCGSWARSGINRRLVYSSWWRLPMAFMPNWTMISAHRRRRTGKTCSVKTRMTRCSISARNLRAA